MRKHRCGSLPLACLAAGLVLGARAGGQTISINFDDVDATGGPVSVFDLSFWFYDRNIWGIGYTPGTNLGVVNYSRPGGVPRIVPPSTPNYFTQFNYNEQTPVAWIFEFTHPVAEFRFARCRLAGTQSQTIIHPAWTAIALDSNLNVLDSVSEDAITATSNVPARTVVLTAAGISQVEFMSDGLGVSTVPALVIDNMSMAVCCTGDFDGDGDAATNADIEAFFACLGGNCCATCGPADFNCDGDAGTDADIEAFFRVLAGGHC
jgi:hypothetical protein